jgi:hypothetical protein
MDTVMLAEAPITLQAILDLTKSRIRGTSTRCNCFARRLLRDHWSHQPRPGWV